MTVFTNTQMMSQESFVSTTSSMDAINFNNNNVAGDICMKLDYIDRKESLEITVKECKGLASVDSKKRRCNPYVAYIWTQL